MSCYSIESISSASSTDKVQSISKISSSQLFSLREGNQGKTPLYRAASQPNVSIHPNFPATALTPNIERRNNSQSDHYFKNSNSPYWQHRSKGRYANQIKSNARNCDISNDSLLFKPKTGLKKEEVFRSSELQKACEELRRDADNILLSEDEWKNILKFDYVNKSFDADLLEAIYLLRNAYRKGLFSKTKNVSNF